MNRLKLYGRRIAVLILISVPLIAIGGCQSLFASVYLSDKLAHNLVPADYPNSTLLQVGREGSSDHIWEYKTYYTTDNVAQVVAFFEQKLPGFTAFPSTTYSTAYVNSMIDASPFARVVSWVATAGQSDEHLPTVSIQIYPSSTKPIGTEIMIRIDWASF